MACERRKDLRMSWEMTSAGIEEEMRVARVDFPEPGGPDTGVGLCVSKCHLFGVL